MRIRRIRLWVGSLLPLLAAAGTCASANPAFAAVTYQPYIQPGNAGPGLALLMGEKTPVLIGNTLAMMKEGVLEPVEMIARA